MNLIIGYIIVRKIFDNDSIYNFPNGNFEYFLFILYAVSSTFCYGFSTTFHTFQCHSQHSLAKYACWDYCGIAIHMFGAMIPLLHFVFYCERLLFIRYSIFYSILAGSFIIFLNVNDFSKPHYRWIKCGIVFYI